MKQFPSRKRSKSSRSGYLEQSNQGKSQGERGDIQLTERNPKFNYVHTVTVGAASSYDSTAELNDWETEKNRLASASLGNKTILSTVKITQL
jgi:hypothetical protein